MLRKSTFVLNNINPGKKAYLIKVMEESRRVVNVFIDMLWAQEKFTGKFISLKTDTWLSAILQQNLSKQALDIVKGQRNRKVKTKPVLKKLCLVLDYRLIVFTQVENSFDFWVRLRCFVRRGLRIWAPSHKHRHFNALVQDGWKLKSAARLGVKGNDLILDVYLEKETPALKTQGKTIGIDIGYNKLIATSEGQTFGDKFKTLAEKIRRKKQGSNGFKKALIERDQYVNKTVKELPLNEANVIVLEALKGLKKGKPFRKEFRAKFLRWTYPALVRRLELTSERQGVLVAKVEPAFTSQTCSRCGTKDKKSRNGETFTCTSCGFESDADINASVNISKRFQLPEHLDPAKSDH